MSYTEEELLTSIRKIIERWSKKYSTTAGDPKAYLRYVFENFDQMWTAHPEFFADIPERIPRKVIVDQVSKNYDAIEIQWGKMLTREAVPGYKYFEAMTGRGMTADKEFPHELSERVLSTVKNLPKKIPGMIPMLKVGVPASMIGTIGYFYNKYSNSTPEDED